MPEYKYFKELGWWNELEILRTKTFDTLPSTLLLRPSWPPLCGTHMVCMWALSTLCTIGKEYLSPVWNFFFFFLKSLVGRQLCVSWEQKNLSCGVGGPPLMILDTRGASCHVWVVGHGHGSTISSIFFFLLILSWFSAVGLQSHSYKKTYDWRRGFPISFQELCHSNGSLYVTMSNGQGMGRWVRFGSGLQCTLTPKCLDHII